MVITHNILGMNAQRQFNIAGKKKAKSTEKLSSGFKINRAADDAAGLTISEKMRSQIRGLTQGVYNTQDGVSMCQVADGALEEVDDMLHRLTELAIKSANGTNTDQDREAIDQEKKEIIKEINRISDTTEFNERKIFGSGAAVEYKPLKVSDLSVTGVASTTEAKSYILNASDTGVQFDNTSFAWSDFVDEANNHLDINNIQQGKYSIQHDGFSISFTVGEGAEKEEIIGKVSGSKFITKSVSEVKDKFEIIGHDRMSFRFSKPYDGSGTIKSYYYRFPTHTGIKFEYVDSDNDNTLIYPVQSTYASGGSIGNRPDGTKNFCLSYESWRVYVNPTIDFTEEDRYYFANSMEYSVIDLNDYTINNKGEYYYANDNITFTGYIPKVTIEHPSEISSITQSDYKGIPVYPTDQDIANTPLSIWIQSGCKAGDGINLEFDAMNTGVLGISNIDLSSIEGARFAIAKIETALDLNNANRSKIGAQQNRLEHTIDNENNIVENTTAAESRIRDTDMTKETANLAVQNILTQAGVAMMAQANQQNQGVLQLLQV